MVNEKLRLRIGECPELARLYNRQATSLQQQAGLTGVCEIGYDRRLSICSGKDNKAESAASRRAEPPFEQFIY
jgi:hypothetical protein